LASTRTKPLSLSMTASLMAVIVGGRDVGAAGKALLSHPFHTLRAGFSAEAGWALPPIDSPNLHPQATTGRQSGRPHEIPLSSARAAPGPRASFLRSEGRRAQAGGDDQDHRHAYHQPVVDERPVAAGAQQPQQEGDRQEPGDGG